MKGTIFFVLLCFLPALILGNPIAQQAGRERHHFNHRMECDYFSRKLRTVPLPVNPDQAKDRDWRLSQALYKYDENWRTERELVNGELLIYHYNLNQPARLDSITRFGWASWEMAWGYQDTRIYLYDPTGEYIVEERVCDTYYYPAPNNIFEQTFCTYDDQHRLTDAVEFGSYDWNPGFFDYVDHSYFRYANNRLIRTDYVYSEDGENDYGKEEYTLDNQGRRVAGYFYDSYDSLAWELVGKDTLSYNINDTSTGEGFVSYLAHNYILQKMKNEFPLLYGMISEFTYYEDWMDTFWDEGYRHTFTYNPTAQPWLITGYFWDGWNGVGSWYQSDLYSFSYDSNQNHIRTDYQYWNSDNEAWSDTMEQYIYTWEQHSAAEDNIAPIAATMLSAYPNPFCRNTLISFKLNVPMKAEVEIYNLKGQRVCRLANADYSKGKHSLLWDGRSEKGSPLPAGIYLCRLKGGSQSVTVKLTLIR